jgi:translocation and assembly module TamB
MRKPILIISIGLTLVVGGAVFYILNSAPGSRWMVRSAINSVFKGARLDGISGRLFSGISIQKFYFNRNGVALELKNITFNVQPRSLLAGAIRFKNLSVESALFFETGAAQPEALVKAMLNGVAHVPMALACENAEIRRLTIQAKDYEKKINPLHFTAKLDSNRFYLPHLDAKDEFMEVALQGSLGLAQPNPFRGNVNWRAHDRDGKTLRGKARLEGDCNMVTIEHWLFEPHWIKTSGQLKIKQLKPASSPALREGGGAVSGRKQSSKKNSADFRIDFNGIIDGQGFPPLGIQAQGQTDASGISLNHAVINTLEGVVHAIGRIDFSNGPSWRLKIDAKNLNPDCYWASLQGNITLLKADINGEINKGRLEFRVPRLNITGEMLGKPFLADGAFMLEDKNTAIDHLDIRSGESSLSVKGQINPNMNLSFQFTAEDPAHLWPGLTGRFAGEGEMKGRWGDVSTLFKLSGSQVAYKTKYYGNYSIQSLSVDLKAKMGTETYAESKIKMDDLKIGDTFPIEHYEIASKGNLAHSSHVISLKSQQMNCSAALIYDYNRNDESMRIHVGNLRVESNRAGKWILGHSTDMLVSHFEVKPASGCLEQNGRRTCIEGSWKSKNGWEIKGDLKKEPIPSISRILELLRNEIPAFQGETTVAKNGSAAN